MATRIVMPQLGESLAEGTIGVWLKQEGDWVKEYEPLLEIETDKVTAEYPSPVTGYLTKITVHEGETVAVGDEIGWVEEADGAAGAAGASSAGAAGGVAADEQRGGSREEGGPPHGQPAAGKAGDGKARDDAASPSTSGDREADRKYSPAVKRLARERGLDLAALAQVPGTGKGGRVTKQDVEQWVAKEERDADGRDVVTGGGVPIGTEPEEGTTATGAAGTTGPHGPTETGSPPDAEVAPLTAMRRTIAERMAQSVHEAPHAWMMVETDVTRLVALRDGRKEPFGRREGAPLTYLPFVIRAVVGALKEVPRLNASWGGDHIRLYRSVHIGVAVGLEEGLVVPVIRNADGKSIAALARSVHDLVTRAREGKLSYEELHGSTFTVNNTGAFGSILSVPIINPPEAGILSMESIVKRPVVVDDAIAIRSMMNLSLSVDHRVVDGLTAGRFLASVKRGLEAYGPETALW